VEAVAVIGVEHPHSGEAVKAYVVNGAGYPVDEEALIDFCATRLARYKCPSKILFVDELPQGLGGKVLKRQLRS
jgi:long-chain acyl-CoA synthetase